MAQNPKKLDNICLFDCGSGVVIPQEVQRQVLPGQSEADKYLVRMVEASKYEKDSSSSINAQSSTENDFHIIVLPYTISHRSEEMEMSYFAYQWLKNNDKFKLVVFPDRQGCGYYSFLAKHQGLAFESTIFAVAGDGPTEWKRKESFFIPHKIDQLILDYLERRAIEMADIYFLPDKKPIVWLEEKNWKLPANTIVKEDIEKSEDKIFSMGSSITPSDTRQPLVSVCLVHYNRPERLQLALQSILKQTYKNFEVVLVDDGSTDREALMTLKDLEANFENRGWNLIYQENKYIGAARNTAAKNARGDFLLFMDDDNYAKPNEIDTLVKVALKTGADIVTCAMEVFSDTGVVEEPKESLGVYLYLGDAAELWIYDNFFGDANSLIRKSLFEEIGGFTEDRNSTWEDLEFFIKASINGALIETVPEALYWYRLSADSMFRTSSLAKNYRRAARPLLKTVSKDFENIMFAAQGLYHQNRLLEGALRDYKTKIEETNIEISMLKAGVNQVYDLQDKENELKLKKMCRRLIRAHRNSFPSKASAVFGGEDKSLDDMTLKQLENIIQNLRTRSESNRKDQAHPPKDTDKRGHKNAAEKN